MRAGSAHVSERVRANGQVLQLRGQPLPGGGYATSYSDVTDYKRVERELREINEYLSSAGPSAHAERRWRRERGRAFPPPSTTTCCSRPTPRAWSPRRCAEA